MSEANEVLSNASAIRKQVAEKVLERTKEGAVREAVVNALVSEELKQREATLLAGLNKIGEITGLLRRVKPDNVIFGVDGKAITEGWTKAKLDEKKKLEDQLERLNKALDLAFISFDFSKLKEAVNAGIGAEIEKKNG